MTLRLTGRSEEPVPSCRFALVELLPRPWHGSGLVEGLQEVFRDVVRPEHAADPEAEEVGGPSPADAHGPRGVSASQPFESTPLALRSALVVDPDDAGRRAVAECLARHGFTVHEAASCADGLRLAVARRPWLVIAEQRLADESGLAFCRQVRAHSLLRRTRVVFRALMDHPGDVVRVDAPGGSFTVSLLKVE